MLASTPQGAARTSEVPVLISGGGPTGLFAGILLQKMNIPCRIIERDLEVSPLSKALGIHARSQEIFQMTDPELIQELERQGKHTGSFRIYYDGKLTSDIEPTVSRDSHYSRILLLPQSNTVKIISDAYEKDGGQIDRGWELMDTKVIEDGEASWVETTIRKAIAGTNKRIGESDMILGTLDIAEEDKEKQYEYETVKSQYLIAADGGRSAVRHKIQMPFPGRTRDFNLILFDGFLDATISTDHVSVVNGCNNRTVAMFPLGEPTRVRIMFDNGTLTPEEFEDQKSNPLTTEHFQRLLDETVKPLTMKITKVNWLTYYRVNERRAQDYTYKGRIFLAGDAAHVHSPAGGQGMNTGFQDVYNLSWKIAMVVNGSARPSLLDSYNEERPAIGDEIIALSSKTLEDALGHDLMHRMLKRAAVALAPVLMPLMANRAPTISMLGLRYYENSLNKRNLSQVYSPTAPGAIGRRAPDSAIVPFCSVIDSGHHSNSSGSSSDGDDSGEDHSNNLSVMTTALANGDATRLHELIAQPGVFQVLVFTGNQWKHQPDAAARFVKRMNNYLAKWRLAWPSNKDDTTLRPQFMVHALTTITPAKAPAAANILESRRVGEGKPYRDLGKELHARYGVDSAVKKNPDGGAIVVVRPDSHIAYRVQGAGAAGWEDVDDYFESIMVQSN